MNEEFEKRKAAVQATLDSIEDVSPDPDAATPPEGQPPVVDPADPRPAEGARLPLNDTGNGARFALYCGTAALHVPRVGWHVWDDRRWKLDPDGITVRRHAQSIQYHIAEEIPHLVLEDWQIEKIAREPDLRKRRETLAEVKSAERTTEQAQELEEVDRALLQIRKLKERRSALRAEHRSFAKSSGNKAKIDAMLVEATTSLSHEVEHLDSDPLAINTESGLIRFNVIRPGPDDGFSRMAEWRLEPHERFPAGPDPDTPQIVTKMMPVRYDPSATCPQFDAFLERIQPDLTMRLFLQRWWGVSMTALPLQKFVFQYGRGANGKSVLSDLMGRIFGDYSTVVKIESLTGKNRRGGGDATPDLMPLVGARAARANEPEEGDRLQEGMIKDMTGGEPILVRQLHADFIEVRPHFKLTMSGNHKPDIRGTDDGIWRRVLLVPFDVQIPEAERDDKLVEKLYAERSGILNWLILGLRDFLEVGLQEPEQVLAATSEYRADSDPIGSFLGECCGVTGMPGDFLSARELIDAFNYWLDSRGEAMWGLRTVSNKIKAEAGRYRDPATNKPFTPGKNDTTGYFGIRFLPEFKEALDRAPRNAQGRPQYGPAPASRSEQEDFR